MDVRVDGKVALVTGSSRGIGQAVALELALSGAGGVVMTSRKLENLERAREQIVAAGAVLDKIHIVVARADSEDDAALAVKEVINRFGGCDILVNNAGTNPAAGPLVSVDLGAVDKTWAVNQRGPLVGRNRPSGSGWAIKAVRSSTWLQRVDSDGFDPGCGQRLEGRAAST